MGERAQTVEWSTVHGRTTLGTESLTEAIPRGKERRTRCDWTSGEAPASARVSGRSVIVINRSVMTSLTKPYRNDGKLYRGNLTVLQNGSFLGKCGRLNESEINSDDDRICPKNRLSCPNVLF